MLIRFPLSKQETKVLDPKAIDLLSKRHSHVIKKIKLTVSRCPPARSGVD